MYQWIINLLGMVGLAISTPPIASESGGVSAGSASAGATGATEQAVESLLVHYWNHQADTGGKTAKGCM